MKIIESAGRAPSLKLYPGICLTTEGKALHFIKYMAMLTVLYPPKILL